MSGYAGSSSDLSEIEDGAGLKSDAGSNASEHEVYADAESAPETEAETERLEISPQKPNPANGTADATPDTTPSRFSKDNTQDTPQPGLTAQDILGDDPATSDEDDAHQKNSPAAELDQPNLKSPGLAGRKRKRTISASAATAHIASSTSPAAKKRASSMRLDRKALDRTKGARPRKGNGEQQTLLDETSADEAEDLENGADLTSQRNTPNPNEEDEDAPLNDHLEDEEDPEIPGDAADDETADAEVDAAAKTEDELAKKKGAMDALIPIEKLFAIFRDKLFDERWAELSAELEILNASNPTHAEYLAMRQALDTRRDEKLQLEQVTLDYKVKALETKILAERAQIHSQYYQTARDARERYLDKLNQQFSQIQRERRQCKTKEPHYIYNFEPRRSKQIANQTAYNTEVSLLSGIARHVGFPAAPIMRGASQQDVEDDLRQMKIQIKPSSRPVTSQIARAEEAAVEEQFLEKTPWANPRHPAHQQGRVERNFVDAAKPPSSTPANRVIDYHRPPAGSGSTIGISSDPPSGLAYSETIINGSSPFDQMKRRDELINNHNTSEPSGFRGKPGYVIDSSPPHPSYDPVPLAAASTVEDNVGEISAYNPRSGIYTSPGLGPLPSIAEDRRQSDMPRENHELYDRPALAARDAPFVPAAAAAARESMTNPMGVSRPFGVR